VLKAYVIWGLVVLGLLAAAEFRGWSLLDASETRDPVPASVRENPGSYRPIYVGGRPYVGGK